MLNIHIPTIIFQIINFAILAVVLYFLLFRTVTKKIKERAAQKEQLLNELEQNKLESEKLLTEYQNRLAGVSQEVDAIIEKAQKQLESNRKDFFAELENEAKRKITEAEDEEHHQQEVATQKYFDQILNQVLETSRYLVEKSAPPQLHQLLIQQLADETWRLGREDLQRVASIRSSLKERTPIVHVDTAQPLNTEQQGLLIRTFSALADRNIKLEINLNSSLGAGCRVRIGDLVVDNSIDSQIQKLKETATVELQKRLSIENPNENH